MTSNNNRTNSETVGEMEKLLSVARGDTPADLLLLNCKVINTFSGGIEETNIALCQDKIAGLGKYRDGVEIVDLSGRFICPGLIDGHIHLESTLLNPIEYANIVVPRGVLGIVTDFHEIANVCGVEGIRYILDYTDSIPMDIFGMAPSCVPATHLENSGAFLDARVLHELMACPNMIGLGEMMNFPGVVSGESSVIGKINSFRDKPIDGHAPGLAGRRLNAYVAAGIGSDHESTTLAEAEEKLSRGMYVMIREGSSEKNLETLLPLVTDRTYRRCFFVVDDRHCVDLIQDGDVDGIIRKAIKKGLDPIRAIQMATINTVECFGIKGLGAIAPGYRANFSVTDDMENLEPKMVYYKGRLVAENGNMIVSVPDHNKGALGNTINIRPFQMDDLILYGKGKTFPTIVIIPDQIITRRSDEYVSNEDGIVMPDVEKDLLKLVVFERHRATGNIGIGLVKGFGFKKGAIASSIAHDSHNIISVGTNDRDIYIAVKELERIHGGLSIASDNHVLGSLPLPIAGILSHDPADHVIEKLERLGLIIKELGCTLRDPFSILSFLALPVIPEIRLTDLGIVDVTRFELINP